MVSVVDVIAITTSIGSIVAIIIKLLSMACFQSKCSKIKCCCIEVERNVNIEQQNMTFDENVAQSNSQVTHPQDIHINIDHSPAFVGRKLEENK